MIKFCLSCRGLGSFLGRSLIPGDSLFFGLFFFSTFVCYSTKVGGVFTIIYWLSLILFFFLPLHSRAKCFILLTAQPLA